MSLIEIPLPYTEGKGNLLLTTGSASYARLAWDAPQRVKVFEEAENAHEYAKEAMAKIEEFLGHFDKQTGKLQGATIETANEAAGKVNTAVTTARAAADNARSASTAANPPHLFKTTADSARAAADAASETQVAFNKFLTDRDAAPDVVDALSKAARDAYTKLKEEVEKAGAKIGANKKTAKQFDRNNRKMVLVIGGGVSGLMTAWILLDKGYRVSIVAKEWRTKDENKPERMTSQIAGALWEYPPGGCGLSEIEVPVLAYSTLKQYRDWALQSFLFYEHLATSTTFKEFGARMVTLYQLFHHSHKANANIGDTDPVVRRARESAKDHYNKWLAISNLDGEVSKFENNWKPGPFKGRLKAAKWEADAGDVDVAWQPALGAISHSSEDFKLKWGYIHQAPVVDTDVAMNFLMKLVRDKGAILETREIKEDLHLQERELKDDFKADIIVNASGLGARVLANDNQVFPVRGAVRRMALQPKKPPADSSQATKERIEFLQKNAVLLPAQYDVNNHPSKTIFIVPRNDHTLVVGSIIQRNSWDLGLTVDSPEVEDMWERAQKFVPALSGLEEDSRKLAQGLRPFSHSNVRVSADNRTTDCRVVHNYGHGGSGWTLAVGCAWTCVRIVEKILHEGKSGSVANAEVWGLGKH